jgi:hypothetical protein
MNLKIIEKVFTSKFIGPGLPGRGLTKVEKHWRRQYNISEEKKEEEMWNSHNVELSDNSEPRFGKDVERSTWSNLGHHSSLYLEVLRLYSSQRLSKSTAD